MTRALARLKLLTKSRNETPEEIELSLEVYSEELAAYPADIAAYVLRTQAGMNIFWPAWAELKDRLEMMLRRRRLILEALQRGYQPRLERPKPVRGEAAMQAFKRVREALNLPAAASSAGAAETILDAPLVDLSSEELDRRRAELVAECERLGAVSP